jgi:two-component system response regulator FlrC
MPFFCSFTAHIAQHGKLTTEQEGDMRTNTVLVVEDDDDLREALCDTLRLAGYTVAEAPDGKAALTVVKRDEINLVLTDIKMKPMDGQTFLEKVKAIRPELPVLVMTAFGTIDGAIKAMRAGAIDYLPKPFQVETLLAHIHNALLHSTADQGGMIACDSRSQELLHLALRVAHSDVTVLISGESGTGKEVLAQFIHRSSRRAAAPFIAINCAAIPENLLEATLFGYEKGAFTGAHRACPGKFEQAQGGTLLLDEISEMELGLQAKLLRVLQERVVERIGAHRPINLDVRVLATSNRDLRAQVKAGQFREDLYYRLNVFPLHIPPLRERPADILPLARHFLARLAQELGRPTPTLTKAAEERLLKHSWPGNIRELDNLMQRTMILQPNTVIEVDALHFENTATHFDRPEAPCLGDDLKFREQELIIDTLQSVMGNRQAAASRLGISPRTLRYKLARLREAGITIPNR